MNQQRLSPTYARLLDILFKTDTMKMDVHKVEMIGGLFARIKTGFKSDQLQQDFYISASELWGQCTPHEWYLVGRISSELKEYNALWHCNPEIKKSSSNKKAIHDLIEKGVLVKTETTDIYIVNPIFIRRGDFKTVLVTTAAAIMSSEKVAIKHIKDRRALSSFNTTKDILKLRELLQNQDNSSEQSTLDAQI